MEMEHAINLLKKAAIHAETKREELFVSTIIRAEPAGLSVTFTPDESVYRDKLPIRAYTMQWEALLWVGPNNNPLIDIIDHTFNNYHGRLREAA